MDESSEHKPSEEMGTEDLRAAINDAIRAIAKRFTDNNSDLKTAVTDLTKLLQLRKELEGDRPRHVSARWIDECEKSKEE